MTRRRLWDFDQLDAAQITHTLKLLQEERAENFMTVTLPSGRCVTVYATGVIEEQMQ